MLFAAFLSLTDWSGIGDLGELGALFTGAEEAAPTAAGDAQAARQPVRWVGLQNYQRAFTDTPLYEQDEYFRLCVKNTAVYAVASVVLTLVAALGLMMFQSLHGSFANLLMAASVITAAPLVILFFVAQRFLVRGILLTGMKG